MTVSYQSKVSSSSSAGFTKLLFLWRGSLYQVLYRELLLFMVAFVIISALYRNAFTDAQKEIFEKIVRYCDAFISQLPLSFILGFYVTYVAKRWWNQYLAIPWPDRAMHVISMYVEGNDDYGCMIRRSLMRYLILTLILVLRSISSPVKKRFPTLEHVAESGYMTADEIEVFYSLPKVEFNTYWVPCTWFISLLKEARKSKRIEDSEGVKLIMQEFIDFRSKCGFLWSYDWISIPLAYTQVVTIATYSFFITAVVGRQYVEGSNKMLQTELDVYIPVFTIVQFLFFMGLLKVAEQLINPFGDDEEDFELNYLIDRHTKAAYLAVDYLAKIKIPLVKDIYFNELEVSIPYTSASVPFKKKSHRGSVHHMPVPEDQHMMFLPEIIEEADPDRSRSRRTSMCSTKSEGKIKPNRDKFNDSYGIMQVVQQRTTSNGCGEVGGGQNSNAPAKRGGGGFRQLAQRKSDAAQPVVLVSMTRRPSYNSGQWKPFKWKSSDSGEQRRASVGGGGRRPEQHQQTDVDLQKADRPETSATVVPEGRVNAAFVPDRLQHDV
ncbi:bestrophin-4-like [Metopolophium dirhodum]|uniref:bestrophin-4-like n=1 Tax=Metopolophium dirhodum TaxID=44670 RepID=UPI00298F4949|nr:bestrophin-4-like [Metopolophium dirhodum]